MIKEKYQLLTIILLLIVIHQSQSQIIAKNLDLNLQQNEYYLQELSDLYDFTAKSINFPIGYPSDQINQPYQSLSDTKNNQITTIQLASYNDGGARYFIGLNIQEKNSNNIDMILSFYRVYINSKNNIIRREELSNRKVETLDAKYMPNYYYGSMFNKTSGFVSYYSINETYQQFRKSVFFFNYLDKIGITFQSIPNIDLFKHTSILGPEEVIYLVQYRFKQFQLYKFNNTEISLVDLTKTYKETDISKFIIDEGKYYIAFSLENSTLYYSSIDLNVEKITIREIVLPQKFRKESEVFGQRLNDYLFIFITDSRSTSILKLQSFDFLNHGTLKLAKNDKVPFGMGINSFPTLISENNFIFISDNQIQLADINKSRIIFSQQFDQDQIFYSLNYYQNQFILYFSNQDSKGKITYPSKQVLFKVPSIVIYGKLQQQAVLISSSFFPFSVNVTITVSIPSKNLVTFSKKQVLVTKIFDILPISIQYFPVELFVTGTDLSLAVLVPEASQSLINQVNFVKLQELSIYQKLNVDISFQAFQTDYYFASIIQKKKIISQKEKTQIKSDDILILDKNGSQNSTQESVLSENEKNTSNDQSQYQILALLPVQNQDGSGGIQQLSNSNTFSSEIDQIDNAGSFTLKQDNSPTLKRVYLSFVDYNNLILNYYEQECEKQFIFATDPFFNVLFTACGQQLQFTTYVSSGYSNKPINITQQFNLTIDASPYNKILTNRGLLFLYSDTQIVAFDYINFNYFSSFIKIDKLSDLQQIILFRQSFVVIYAQIQMKSEQSNQGTNNNVKIAEYSYNNFVSEKPILLRYLQTDGDHVINNEIKVIAVRNDIEYLLLQQSGQNSYYNVYRMSSQTYSQNQLYTTIQIPSDSILIINSNMFCILQTGNNSNMNNNINDNNDIKCTQILQSASIQYQLALTDSEFNNNLSFTAQILLTNGQQQQQIYNLVLQRNAEVRNMLVDQKSVNVQLIRDQFYNGDWNPSTLFSFNDQKIINVCILGWYSSYLPCTINNRISYTNTQNTQLKLFLQNKLESNLLEQERIQVNNNENYDQQNKKYNNGKQNDKESHRQMRILMNNNILFSKKQLINQNMNYNNHQKQNTNIIPHFNSQNIQKYDDNYFKITKKQTLKIANNSNDEQYNNNFKKKLKNKAEFINQVAQQSNTNNQQNILSRAGEDKDSQVSIFSFLYNQRVTISSNEVNIMNLLQIKEYYFGCIALDDSASVTNRGQAFFNMDMYILCSKQLIKYNLQIQKNNNNQYIGVESISKQIYIGDYTYDVSPFQKLITFDQSIIMTKFNGDKHKLVINKQTFYIDPNLLPYTTLISLNVIYSLGDKIQMTFFENGVVYVQLFKTSGIQNQYLSIADLLESNNYTINDCDSINSVEQYMDTQFRVAFTNSFIYDIQFNLNSDGSILISNASLFYYRDAFTKYQSGFKGSNYLLFLGLQNDSYVLSLYSVANSKQSQYLIESTLQLPFNSQIQGIRYVLQVNNSTIQISFSNGNAFTFKISPLISFTVNINKTLIPQKGIEIEPIKSMNPLNKILLVVKETPPNPPPSSYQSMLIFSLQLLFILCILQGI